MRGASDRGDGEGGATGEGGRGGCYSPADRINAIGNGRVGETVGRLWVESNTTRRNSLSYSKQAGSFSVGPSTGVSLSESRVRSIGLWVETRRGGGFTFAGCERVVGVVKVLDSHDKRTAHDVKFMLALQGGSRVGVFGCTDTQAELVV